MRTGNLRPHPTHVVALGCNVAVTVDVDVLVRPGRVLVVVFVTVDVLQRTALAKKCANSSACRGELVSSRLLIAPPEPEFDEPGRLLWTGTNLIAC